MIRVWIFDVCYGFVEDVVEMLILVIELVMVGGEIVLFELLIFGVDGRVFLWLGIFENI